MAYQATVINIMIISSGDVSDERSAIQTIIHRWNTMHAAEHRTVLMPLMWETHSTPEMCDHARAIINRQALETCDLLVAVFWARLGRSTASSPSGTVEEIRKHLESGKPAMVYFSQKPIIPESVDRDQYEAVQEFREECRTRGLIGAFKDLQKFHDQIALHLGQIVRDRFTDTGGPNDGSEAASSLPAAELSEEAKAILVAATDGDGQILRLNWVSGARISAGQEQFMSDDRREQAKWDATIWELVHVGFIEPRGTKAEAFQVTHGGYHAADGFRLSSSSED
jgi:hypothetical protein